jgi:hypothetical protein
MTYGRLSVDVASSLLLSHLVHPKSHSESVSNYFALWQSLFKPLGGDATSNLNVEQIVEVVRATALKQNLSLIGVVSKQWIHNENPESNLNLESFVGLYKVDRCHYITAIPIPTPPVPIDIPGVGLRNVVYFEQTPLSIQLPRPEIGNNERFDFSRINRRSRGGDLILFRDEQWPKTKTLTLTFAWLSEFQKHEILDFMQKTIGQEIVYIDHYGRTWDGFIMTPAAPVTQQSLNDLSLTLDFQGIIQ